MKTQYETSVVRKETWQHRLIATACAVALALLSVPLGVFHAPEIAMADTYTVPADAQASGTSGTCTWYITSESDTDNPSQMVIYPTDGVSGTLASMGSVSTTDVPWYDYRESVLSVYIAPGVSANATFGHAFFDFKNVTSIDVTNLDFSNVTRVPYLFYNCKSVTSIAGISDIDTSQITDFSGMFSQCYLLSELDLSAWDFSSAEKFYDTFFNCWALETLLLPTEVAPNVKNITQTFMECDSLTTLDVSCFANGKIVLMGGIFQGCNNLVNLTGYETLATSTTTTMSAAFNSCSSLPSLDLSQWDTQNVKSFYLLFSQCFKLADVEGLENWSTSSSTNFSRVFYECYLLDDDDLDAVANWDVSNSKTFEETFMACRGVTSLDLSAWNNSIATNLGRTFTGCTALQKLDISGLDTSLATDMTRFFGNLPNLREVTLGSGFSFTGDGTTSCVLPTPNPAYIPGATGNWQAVASGTVDNPTGTVYAPADVPSNVAETYVPEIQKVPILAERATWYKGSAEKSSFTTINIVDSYAATGLETESWDASAEQDGSVTAYISADGATLTIAGNGYGKIFANEISRLAFRDFSSVTAINGTEILDTQNTTDMEGMFEGDAALLSLNLDNWNVSRVTNMGSVFSGCTSLTSLGSTALRNWDVSAAKTIFTMFSQCSSLETLDTSLWTLSSCEYFDFAFRNCSSLTTLDVSGWNTSSAKSMIGTFYGCSSVGALDVSGWETQNVASMRSLFSGCKTLTSLDVSNFETSACTNTSAMFLGCNNLQTIEGINGLDTSNVTDLRNMFAGCKSLTELDLSNLSSSSCTHGIKDMFYNCESLKVLDISGFDTSVCDEMDNAFYGCVRLQQVTLGSGFTFNGSGSDRLTNLPTPDPTYIPGAIGKWQAVGTGSITAPAGTIYDPVDIPNNVAETYVMPLATMDINVPIKVKVAVDAKGNFVTPTATGNKIINNSLISAKVVSAVAAAKSNFTLLAKSAVGTSAVSNVFGGTIAANGGTASDLSNISTTGSNWSMANGSSTDGSNMILLQLTGAIQNVKGHYLTKATNVFDITYTFELDY